MHLLAFLHLILPAGEKLQNKCRIRFVHPQVFDSHADAVRLAVGYHHVQPIIVDAQCEIW